MENEIFRTSDVFTEENIKKLFRAFADDCPDIHVEIIGDSVLKVRVSHPKKLYTDCTFLIVIVYD